MNNAPDPDTVLVELFRRILDLDQRSLRALYCNRTILRKNLRLQKWIFWIIIFGVVVNVFSAVVLTIRLFKKPAQIEQGC